MNRRLAVVALPALLVALAGCGGTTQDASTAARSTTTDTSGTSDTSGSAPAAPGTASLVDEQAARSEARQRAVVSTGRVRLATKDVARTRSRVDDVVAAHGGSVADERSVTDREGRTTSSRLVLRVPSADFDAVISRLTSIGGLRDSGRTSRDVTTDVIDTDQRVRAQRIGLKRVETLPVGPAGSQTSSPSSRRSPAARPSSTRRRSSRPTSPTRPRWRP
jgi:hypothetical protein